MSLEEGADREHHRMMSEVDTLIRNLRLLRVKVITARRVLMSGQERIAEERKHVLAQIAEQRARIAAADHRRRVAEAS